MSGMKSSTPAPPQPVNDEKLIAGITDRSKKATSPEMFQPKGRWKAGDALVNAFRERRDANIQKLLSTNEDFRAHYTNLGGQVVSVYQGLLFIPGHTERHLKQILEVKSALPK